MENRKNKNNSAALKILCVDDDPADVDLMRMALEQTCVDIEYDMIVGEHGEQAIDLLANDDYDIILLDFKLPRMNGIEVLEHIRKIPRLKYVPVLLFSGAEIGRFLAKAESLGISAFFLKPVNMTTFSETFRRICDGWFRPIAEAKAS